MDLKPVDALKAAGVPEDKARAFMDSLHRDLDQRYGMPTAQFVTRSDFAEAISGVKVSIAQLDTKIAQLDAKAMTALAEVKTAIADTKSDLTRWLLGSMIAMTAVILTAVRLTSH
jgi:hypothetical protein